MNKIKILTAIILVISANACIFTACKKPDPVLETTTAQISTTKNNGYVYNENFSLTDEAVTQYVHVAPPVPTKPNINHNPITNKPEDTDTKQTPNKVEEKKEGLNILTKTNPVAKGNSASIVIMGTPGAEYTIEFYDANGIKATYSGLGTTKSDTSGIASWTFAIENSCASGDGKVIIREKNSDKYIQTPITIM